MRFGVLVVGIVIGIGLSIGWLVPVYDRTTTEALSEDARLAIEVRCQGQRGRAARECRSLLKKLFLAGSLDPDRTLRAYCEEAEQSYWGGGRPPPPPLCVERYGGWREG